MKTEKRQIQKAIRFTEEEYRQIEEAAEEEQRNECDFMRLAIMEYIRIRKNIKR